MAMAVRSLADLITVSRASTATRVNPAGLVEVVSANTARFDYDPVTLLPMGLLVEHSRTNLALRSEEFDQSFWTKVAATVTANAAISPDGTMNADKLVEDTTNAIHYAAWTPTVTVTPYSMSVYAKAGERSWLRIGNSSDSQQMAWFDVANGVVGTTSAGVTTRISSAGNGWYRCSVSFTPVSATPKTFSLMLGNANNSATYTGTAGNGMFLWGAQLEAGAYPSSYIPTTTTTATRNADNISVGSDRFPDFYNASAGTFFAEIEFPAGWVSVSNSRILGAIAASSVSFLNCTGPAGVQIWNGTTALTKTSPTDLAGRRAKIASAFSGGGTDLAVTLDGLAPTTGTSAGAFNNITALGLGASISGSLPLGGWIRNVRYFPRRFTNAELQALTV